MRRVTGNTWGLLCMREWIMCGEERMEVIAHLTLPHLFRLKRDWLDWPWKVLDDWLDTTLWIASPFDIPPSFVSITCSFSVFSEEPQRRKDFLSEWKGIEIGKAVRLLSNYLVDYSGHNDYYEWLGRIEKERWLGWKDWVGIKDEQYMGDRTSLRRHIAFWPSILYESWRKFYL